ncbi:MAG: hypothetical protein JNK60_15055 [Acidobacteria bacterium]|nr:hypothetical protein [Acidobacteriota bacterium]
MSIVDLKDLHQAYTRLSEKFKTLWTFHQFLQGLHKTFFQDAPPYKIDFQALYNDIKRITELMTFQPPAVVLDTINKHEAQLDGMYRTIWEADGKLAPNYVRRFFEKVRTEDEKLLLSLLRFYFYARNVSGDVLDKMDFLITLVGARRSLDDGHYMPRFPQELQKLFGGYLALTKRQPVDPGEVRGLVMAFDQLRKDIEACSRFEDLTEKKILENVRTLKHRVGAAFYSVEVLSAILETNLAAKNKFQKLYEDEEKRISDSTRALDEIEQELERNPAFQQAELREEFQRFKEIREEFEKDKTEGQVRAQDVTRLSESIGSLLAKVDPESKLESTATFTRKTARTVAADPYEQIVAYSLRDPQAMARAETVAATVRDAREARDARDARDARPSAGSERGTEPNYYPAQEQPQQTGPLHDALIAEWAGKILSTVDLMDEGTGSRSSIYGRAIARLRLEAWEISSARRVLREELSQDGHLRERDFLLLEAASLRVRMDEMASEMKEAPEGKPEMAPPEKLRDCAACLGRSQELDRRFRATIEREAREGIRERLNETTRSRFRLLRTFAGLWLLHNSLVPA